MTGQKITWFLDATVAERAVHGRFEAQWWGAAGPGDETGWCVYEITGTEPLRQGTGTDAGDAKAQCEGILRHLAALADWLDAQHPGALRTAREIIARRAAFSGVRDPERAYESGLIHGLTLALSYLGDRPGDISGTGAGGFITDVEMADRDLAGQS